jgi:spore coat polysaccharide biosynthesis protein SpsF
VVVIIQARLTSTRFPEKVLEKIGRKTVIQHCVDNARKAKLVDVVVVAAPHRIPFRGAPLFIGEENNVLLRYYECAIKYKADVIVRITADCPLLNHSWIDYCLTLFFNSDFEYVSNRPFCLDGDDVEVFTFRSLKDAYMNAETPYELEHVTPYIRSHKNIFCLKGNNPLNKIKLSVDTADDLERVRRWYELYG